MKLEQRNEWTGALRSGKYKQGKGVLRTEANEFCCLGVLADLINPLGWHEKAIGMTTGICGTDVSVRAHVFEYGGSPHTRDIPESVLDWRTANALVDMNDGGTPFEKIADFIEANVPVEA